MSSGAYPPRYEELLALPDDVIGEIIDGELVVTPRPSPLAASTRQALGAELGKATAEAAGRHGWWIFDEAKLRLGSNLLVPDLAGWRRQRMPKKSDRKYFELAPDWACEVLSPSSAVIDRTRKVRLYASYGLCWLWVVDPPHRTVEVLWLEGDEWVVVGAFGGDETAHIAPFDSIEIHLGALWRAAGSTLAPAAP
jgi:Uma2 family endonuclease